MRTSLLLVLLVAACDGTGSVKLPESYDPATDTNQTAQIHSLQNDLQGALDALDAATDRIEALETSVGSIGGVLPADVACLHQERYLLLRGNGGLFLTLCSPVDNVTAEQTDGLSDWAPAQTMAQVAPTTWFLPAEDPGVSVRFHITVATEDLCLPSDCSRGARAVN